MLTKYLSRALLLGATYLLPCANAAEPDVTSGGQDAITRVAGSYVVQFVDGFDTSKINTASLPGTIRLKYTSSLFTGISIQLKDTASTTDLDKLSKDFPVKGIWPVHTLTKPISNATAEKVAKRDETTSNSDGSWSLTQVDKLKAKGVTGKGIKVAIVGDGVDYTHPDLGGCFGPGCLISYGYDFVGDVPDSPQPDSDPFDTCSGDGTAAAGIIAAKNSPAGLNGIAPGVTLGAYKVESCTGLIQAARTDFLIAGFLRAYDDGSDIIYVSGTTDLSGWQDDALDAVINQISSKGVACVFQAGNQGDYGPFYTSDGGDSKGAISVGSVDNTKTPRLYQVATWTANGVSHAFNWTWDSYPNWENVSLPLVSVEYANSNQYDCSVTPPANTTDLSNTIILYGENKTCSATTALNTLSKLGARFYLSANAWPGVNNKKRGQSDKSLERRADPVKTGAGFVSSELYYEWKRLLQSGTPVVVNIVDLLHSTRVDTTPNPNGGRPSLGTSWGPTWEMDVKPEFSAPGLSLATLDLVKDGGYVGTNWQSIPGAHAAGVIALLYEVRGRIGTAALKSLLSSTSKPTKFINQTSGPNENTDFLAPVPQQGGGLIQAYNAAYTKTTLDKSSLSFNDTDHFVSTANFTITNNGAEPATYSLTHRGAVTIFTLNEEGAVNRYLWSGGGPYYADVSLSPAKVTIPAGSSASISVSPNPPKGLNATVLPLYSGYIQINSDSKNEEEQLSIPYQGIVGSLHDATVTRYFRIVYQRGKYRWDPVPTNFTIHLENDKPTKPSVAYHKVNVRLGLNLGTRLAKVQIYPVGGTQSLGEIKPWLLVNEERNIESTYSQVAFRGELTTGEYVPEGGYYLESRVLKVYGDANKAEDWEVRRTDPFVITYEPRPEAAQD